MKTPRPRSLCHKRTDTEETKTDGEKLWQNKSRRLVWGMSLNAKTEKKNPSKYETLHRKSFQIYLRFHNGWVFEQKQKCGNWPDVWCHSFLRYYTTSLRFQNHFTLKQLDKLTVSMENVHLMHSQVSHMSQDSLFQNAGRGCNSNGSFE